MKWIYKIVSRTSAGYAKDILYFTIHLCIYYNHMTCKIIRPTHVLFSNRVSLVNFQISPYLN